MSYGTLASYKLVNAGDSISIGQKADVLILNESTGSVRINIVSGNRENLIDLLAGQLIVLNHVYIDKVTLVSREQNDGNPVTVLWLPYQLKNELLAPPPSISAAYAITNVNVLNTSANPVPVNVQGQPLGVNVGNTPNVNVNSPLDTNGNVKVSVQNAPIGVNVSSPLDANGNVKATLQAPPPLQNAVNVNILTQSLATANTAQALSGTAYNFVIIYNPNSNTIYVGSSSSQPIPIASGGFLTLDVHEAPLNLASIYWVSGTIGNSIVVMYA